MASLLISPPVELRGARYPRVDVRPPVVGSHGDLAVDLMAAAGKPLERWQCDSMDLMLSTRRDGKWACFEYAEWVARQNGKGGLGEARVLTGLFVLGEELLLWSAHEYKDLDVTTPMLTPTGWTTMGELRAGDQVYAPDGQPTEVVAAHPVLRDSDCYRVTFADGQSLVAGGGHLWAVTEVARSGGLARRVVTTEELRTGLVHTWTRPAGRDRRVYRWRIDLPAPLEGRDAALPVDPYLLGMWLGDGDSDGGRLTVGAADLAHVTAELDALGERYSVAEDKRTDGRAYSVGVYGLRVRLRGLGVLGDKRVPVAYLTSSRGQRAALLAGIMDTDGGVCAHQLVVTMVKRDLMEDVTTLIRSLGYRATLRTYRAKIDGRDVGPMYRAQFAPLDGSPFRLARKTAAIVRLRTSRSAYNAIVAVDPVPIRPTRCITVAHPSSSYLAGPGLIPTHNTAMEAFRRVRALIRALGTPVNENLVDVDGVLVKISNTNGEEGFERLDTEQRLKFIARSKGSGRGFSGDVNIIDEAFAFTVDQQDALMPTLVARGNAQIVYLSSPPLTGDTGPVMFALRERAEAGGDDSLGYRDWGIEGNLDDLAKVDLDDRRLWAASNPALGLGRVTEETIGRMRKSMSANHGAGFAREVLGLWPKRRLGGGAIDVAVWAKLLDSLSRREGDVALAVDIAPQRDYAAIGLFGRRGDGVGHVQLVDYRPGTDWIVDRLVVLRGALDPLAVGVGRSTMASLEVDLDKAGFRRPEDRDKPARGDLAVTSGPDMTAATGQFLDAVRQGTVRHTGQQQLDAAVSGAKTRETGDSLAWSRKDADCDIAPLVAVTLARWAFETRAHLMAEAAYDVLESIY